MRFLHAGVAVLIGSAGVRADVVVVLTPEHEAPYLPGETLDVGIGFVQIDDPNDHLLWSVGFDFSQTDPALTLNSFEFDFTAVPFGEFFFHKEDFPTPYWVYLPLTGQSDPRAQWNLPANGTLLTIGMVNITLPMDVSRPLVLDAISPSSAGGFSGGYVSYGREYPVTPSSISLRETASAAGS